MSLNDTPKGERIQIALFGRRNVGKSSVINAITGQSLAIVSDIKGTTTDPVYKAMELLPLGPVMIVDTPGLDDEGELGAERIKRAKDVLNKTDLAIVVADDLSAKDNFSFENEILALIQKKRIPSLLVINKQDEWTKQEKSNPPFGDICISAKTGYHIHELKELIAKSVVNEEEKRHLVSDLISPNDFVVLVVPIDEAAPKGRLILPQQQVIRDILESNSVAIVSKDTELEHTMTSLGIKPSLVITDSQVFGKVSELVPKEIPLTSFSLLFARYKGDLDLFLLGVDKIRRLQDGDTILIAEGCSHHRQCDDIGTVKIPNWLKQHTGKSLNIETCSGNTFPEKLEKYALIIHCGGCTLNQREMSHRLWEAREQSAPIINYGLFIAEVQGILKRCMNLFKPSS